MPPQSAIYIGEMCRYLLTTPESPWDKNHGVKRLFGNGLKGNVWKEFVDRVRDSANSRSSTL